MEGRAGRERWGCGELRGELGALLEKPEEASPRWREHRWRTAENTGSRGGRDPGIAGWQDRRFTRMRSFARRCGGASSRSTEAPRGYAGLGERAREGEQERWPGR